MVLSYIFEDENHPKTSYAAEKKFKENGHMVNKQTIHGWMKQREEILGCPNRLKRLDGGGRKAILGPEVEDIVVGLINVERSDGNRVTGSQVRNWAIEVARERGNDTFQASNGWLSCFVKRNGFSFRRVTNLTILTSDELLKRAKSYMEYLQKSVQSGMVLQNAILMDETAVYLEDPRRITINESGKCT